MTSPMTFLARISLGAILALNTLPVLAADVIYPPGSRVGVVPMEGLAKSSDFSGFESADNGVKVLVAELPVQAFGEVETSLKNGTPPPPNAPKAERIETASGPAFYTIENAKAGTDEVRRYSMIVSGETFAGYVAVQIAKSLEKNYSDDAVKAMFASVTTRKLVPTEEQLGLMPFKVSELADFKNVRTIAPGAALILADGDETSGLEASSFMVLGLVGGAPESSDERARYAEQSASLIPGLREAKTTSAEPIRINGAPGFETRISAVSGKDNTPVTVVQWLRFGGGNAAMRLIGSAPRDQWTMAFPRFRAVRDGLQPR